jgi:serine protease Do
MGLGSGVIIDEKGNILTNEHVVNGADKVKVTLSDGREFEAEIKGKDSRSDLAIIKINAHNLPVVKLGDSDSLKIGQWVVAIGNPFAFALQNPEPTVTVGVVSALHRSLGRVFAHQRDYGNLIQTDAAINPGNSGGPLVNLKGEVVGINTAIFSTSGGYQGVGFAIPINSAKRILSKLVEGKKISYGWLGVTVQDLNEDLAKYFGLADKNGALIAKVLEDAPAAKAGLKEGDVIKQFDNKPINSVKDLLSIVGSTEAGKKVKIVIMRDKKQMALDIQVGERPEDLEAEKEEISEEKGESKVWRGLKVADLTAEIKKRIRTEEKQGVVITAIEPDSPADESGLTATDIITSINRQVVKNISDYEKITKGLKGVALVRTPRGYFLIKESEK